MCSLSFSWCADISKNHFLTNSNAQCPCCHSGWIPESPFSFLVCGCACLCSLFNVATRAGPLSGPFSFLCLKKSSRPSYSEASQDEHSQIQVFFLLSLVAHEFGSALCNYACLLCMCTNMSKNIFQIMKRFRFSSSPNLPTQVLLID